MRSETEDELCFRCFTTMINSLKYASWNRLKRVTEWVTPFSDILLAKVKKSGKPLGAETGNGLYGPQVKYTELGNCG